MRAVVVGAGVSGAFAARTLRRRFGAVLQVDVLGRAERTGGRAWRRAVLGAEVETGASLFHSANPPDRRRTAAAGSVMSIGQVAGTGGSGGDLYKVFSTEEMTEDLLSRFFAASAVTRMTWSAYPYLTPAGVRPGFRLAPRLYCTGAMEYVVSTMETQAIAGVATANLAFRDCR